MNWSCKPLILKRFVIARLSTWPPKGKHLRFHIDPPVQKHVDALVARHQRRDKEAATTPKLPGRQADRDKAQAIAILNSNGGESAQWLDCAGQGWIIDYDCGWM